MSRTDAHRPWWVRQHDPDWRRDFVERHDHRDGVCDLEHWLAGRDGVPARCMRYASGVRNFCGCEMCTNRFRRRYSHRRARVRWRTVARQILATSDAANLDVPSLRAERM